MTAPTTLFATGDLVTAAQLNSFPIALAEATGAAASYDFTSIPAVWTHLLIVCTMQTGSSNTVDDLYLRFNGDTGASYIRQRHTASDTTIVAGSGTSQTAILAGFIPSSTGFSSTAIFVANYAAAQTHSAIAVSYGNYNITGATAQKIGLAGGGWTTAAAINRVTLLPSASTFSAGSMATMYGLGAI